MSTNTNDNLNINQDNIPFQYPFVIETTEDIEILDYDYNEMNFEEIDEEFLNEIDNFKFKK